MGEEFHRQSSLVSGRTFLLRRPLFQRKEYGRCCKWEHRVWRHTGVNHFHHHDFFSLFHAGKVLESVDWPCLARKRRSVRSGPGDFSRAWPWNVVSRALYQHRGSATFLGSWNWHRRHVHQGGWAWSTATWPVNDWQDQNVYEACRVNCYYDNYDWFSGVYG